MAPDPTSSSSGKRPVAQLSAVDGLAQISFLVQGLLQRLAGEHGLSITQARLLGVLRDREPTMTELATVLELDKSSITGLADRAERRGLVVRSAAEEDRRSLRVTLTRRGRSLVSEVADRFAAEIASLLKDLPQGDQTAFAALLSQVLVAHASERGIDLLADPRGRSTP
jgi:MarR family transcriptional regulator, lower aerobic nicotinate degradation pathway regulator